MRYKTHLTTTLVLGLPLMAATHEISLLNLCALEFGSLLPDIDHPASFLGRRVEMISEITNKTFGHRGGTHSFLGMLVVFIICSFIQLKYLNNEAQNITFWLVFGFFCHLLEDSFSKEGIHWFWPYKGKRHYHKLIYYKTGGLSEYLILGCMCCLLLIELRLLWLGTLNNVVPANKILRLQAFFSKLQHIFD